LIGAFDFLTFYLALELQSFGLYILAASKRDSMLSAEAAIKYFILGALTSFIILFGISIIYGVFGTTNFRDLELIAPYYPSLAFLFGLSCVLIGFFFKLGLAPFHSWLPDVYTGAPRFVVSIFAIIPKFSLFILLLRIMFIILPSYFSFTSTLLLITGVFSVIIGTLGGLNQTSILRLIGFSAIANMGFIVFPVTTGSLFGIQASLSFFIVYVMLNFNLFAFILLFRVRNTFLVNNITDFKYLSTFPQIPALNLLNMFSNAGIPPLAGFFSKFYVVFHLFQMHHFLSAVFLLFTSTLSTFYYLRIIRIFSFEPFYFFDLVMQSNYPLFYHC